MNAAPISLLLLLGCAASGGAASRPVEILAPLGDEPVHGIVDVVVAVASDANATSVELWVDEGIRIADWSSAEMLPSLSAELDTTMLPHSIPGIFAPICWRLSIAAWCITIPAYWAVPGWA